MYIVYMYMYIYIYIGGASVIVIIAEWRRGGNKGDNQEIFHLIIKIILIFYTNMYMILI